MKEMYIVQQYISGHWQPICTANSERGIIESLIDIHNDGDNLDEGGKLRLAKFTRGDINHTQVIYEGEKE